MNRRELMLLLGGAMTAARALRAQQKAMPVVGFLGSTSPGPLAPSVAAFHQGLSETGYVERQNITLEYRWAENHNDRLPALAADLVGRKVDVIAAFGIPSALAAKSATSTIPIVFSVGDPIERGLVASLARPGGNITGVSTMGPELISKRLELLSELVPQAGVIALLVNPNHCRHRAHDWRHGGSGAREGGAPPYPEGRRRECIRDRPRRPCPTAGRRAPCRLRTIIQQPARRAGCPGGTP
jgi:putative ABC transport system substrate-binding protein